MTVNKKTAIVLFNLGGPESLEGVQKFLFNLFNDKAIIRLPQPWRFFLAQFISRRRNKKAQGIYQQIGGKSPLLDYTIAQAEALERELSFLGDFKVFINMRYAAPFAAEVVEKIKNYAPSQVILLPLYPQFSSTTTASSVENFAKEFVSLHKNDDKAPTVKLVCCYPVNQGFIGAHADLIKQEILRHNLKNFSELRLLFSAHGLPQKVIDDGDPYAFQVEEGTKKVVEKLAEIFPVQKEQIDFSVCYQSKVGRLQWTSPSLDHALRRAVLDKKIPVIVPISFVSDHSETLVELDIEYRELAQKIGAKNYLRVPSLNSNRDFIETLKKICLEMSLEEKEKSAAQAFCDAKSQRFCPTKFKFCPNQNSCQA